MSRTPKQKYAIGEKLGGLTIVKYMGFVPKNFDNRNEHTYEVKCTCGNIEVKTQNYLNRITSKLMCTKCTDTLKSDRIPPQKKSAIVNNIALTKIWRPIK